MWKYMFKKLECKVCLKDPELTSSCHWLSYLYFITVTAVKYTPNPRIHEHQSQDPDVAYNYFIPDARVAHHQECEQRAAKWALTHVALHWPEDHCNEWMNNNIFTGKYDFVTLYNLHQGATPESIYKV